MRRHARFVLCTATTLLLLATACSSKDAAQPAVKDVGAKQAVKTPDKLTVYYFHTTYRCWTCNQFEKLTKEILAEEFSEQQKAGTLEFKMVNVEEEPNKHFVNDYKLVTKSIVLSLSNKGTETEWKNLDKIWELVRKTDSFKEYVTKHLQAFADKVG